ncbi:TonB-dependent receptor domain-containing protein [Hyphococcus sp.]|uniref:TonB-dependent receptor domain-containing protein n=1 Tax=Hyphococcus sp. TaxID=2038636 RepID=UPI003D12FE5C
MKPYHTLWGGLLASTMLIAPSAFAQDAGTEGAGGASNNLGIQPTYADEIVVLGRNIPEPQRATSQVATFLNTEDLARTGDDTAAEALKRLSGLSIVGGKFAYVRGLGDRYSSARLNGSPLPSPEPLKRTVPLDLFPSNILSGATVQKTFSPNYPGEFGGGIIDLQTLRKPDDNFLNAKLGIGMNTVTTARDGLYVNGGDLDWLGYDDGTRSMPDELKAIVGTDVQLADLTPAEQEAAGESLVNSPLSVIQVGSVGPNFEGSVDGGKFWDLDSGATFSIAGVVGYKQDWTTEEAVRQLASEERVGVNSTQTETALDVTVNGLLSAALETDSHVLTLTGLYIHSTRKEAQVQQGFNFNAEGAGGFVTEANSWLERSLWMGQAAGEHDLSDQFAVNWRGAFARSTRDTPYERSLENRSAPIDADDNIVGPPSIVFNTRHNINFSELTDDTWSGGADFFWYVPVSGAREMTLSAGYEYSDNDREFVSDPFNFTLNTSIPLDVAQARIDYAYSPGNIDPNRFRLIDTNTQGVNSYNGELTVHAGYAQVDAELIPTIRTTAGVRYETADQSVDVFDRFCVNSSDPSDILRCDAFDTELSNDYWLPSAMLTWNFTDNMQLRAGYSHTIARPQFRELAASQFTDPESDRVYFGNSNLKDSEFRNYDLRYEYYLGRNQFLTLAGFYKTIDDPIEEIQFTTTDFSFQSSFINSPKAKLLGGEFEYRTRFSMPGDGWMSEQEWLFSVNYTYTNSEIVVSDTDMITERDGDMVLASSYGLDGLPMVGTPEHIVNAQFGFEGERFQFTVLGGWVSERLLARGEALTKANRLLDVYEKPGFQLDAVLRNDVNIHGTDFTISLAARNLLGTRHIEEQRGVADPDRAPSGVVDFNTYDRGRSLSASLTAHF